MFNYNRPGENLEYISPQLYQEAQDSFHSQMEEFKSNAVNALRLKFNGLLNHIKERLTPDADGKRKTFRNTLVENLHTFIADFNHLNITNDQELAQEVQEVRGIVEGVSSDQLRNNQTLASSVSLAFEEMEGQISTEDIISLPTRRLNFRSIGEAS